MGFFFRSVYVVVFGEEALPLHSEGMAAITKFLREPGGISREMRKLETTGGGKEERSPFSEERRSWKKGGENLLCRQQKSRRGMALQKQEKGGVPWRGTNLDLPIPKGRGY